MATPLRRVEGDQAGPDALGILLPPGERTVLIVRPRALCWDLLLVRGLAGTAFRELARSEATGIAQSFFVALDEWNRGGPGHVAAVAASEGDGFLVWADIGEFALVACERRPGQPYRPAVFAAADAPRAVDLITAALHPAAGQREVYFNNRHFAR